MNHSQDTRSGPQINLRIAALFDEMADLLAARRANDFRVRAYRRGARMLRELLTSVAAILQDSGREGLAKIPGIGQSLAFAIERYIETGRIPMLKQLRDAEVPDSGIGSAREIAARSLQVCDSRTGRAPRRLTPQRTYRDDAHHAEPPVAELLSIDAEYRDRAADDSLLRIAPQRFNPSGDAWLPILRTRRDTRHYTAMYSNTAHAHKLGVTHDWVIIRRTDRGHHQQWTVITSLLGMLEGRRIVRGRESECRAFYQQHPNRVEATERFLAPDEPRQLLLFDQTHGETRASVG